MKENGRIRIQAEYRGEDESFRLNGNIFPTWMDFQEHCIKEYKGKPVDVSIICCGQMSRHYSTTAEEIESLRSRKQDLMKRIVSGCETPKARSCRNCITPC